MAFRCLHEAPRRAARLPLARPLARPAFERPRCLLTKAVGAQSMQPGSEATGNYHEPSSNRTLTCLSDGTLIVRPGHSKHLLAAGGTLTIPPFENVVSLPLDPAAPPLDTAAAAHVHISPAGTPAGERSDAPRPTPAAPTALDISALSMPQATPFAGLAVAQLPGRLPGAPPPLGTASRDSISLHDLQSAPADASAAAAPPSAAARADGGQASAPVDAGSPSGAPGSVAGVSPRQAALDTSEAVVRPSPFASAMPPACLSASAVAGVGGAAPAPVHPIPVRRW